MRTLALAVAVSAIISVGCRDQQPVQPTASAGPEFMISDGAHNGNAHFFFSPPLAPDPSALFHAGTFNSRLSPVVEVCTLTGDPSSGPVDCMTSGGTPVLVFGPAPMALDATAQQYTRNWDTKSPRLLDPTKFYRVLVRGAPRGTALGFLDVDPVDQGLKNLQTGAVVQFQNGRTLPIKVRIEDGAFGSTNPDHVEQVVGNVATTVTTNTGFAGASFPDNWLPQGAVDAGINQVMLIIERIPVGPGTNDPTCLQSGLLEREGCYRFRTDPDLRTFGPFNHLVTAGVCFESPDLIGNPKGPPLELHRRVEVEGAPAGPTIDLAEVAAPFLTCASFGPTQVIGAIRGGGLRGLAGAGWHALLLGIGRLVTPAALHAIDLGAGGSTDGFSRIGWARHATMAKVGGTDGNSAIAGTTLTPDPAVCLVLLHHGVSSPLGNAPVTFTVMTGGGTVGGLNSVTVNTDLETGCAHAPWVLGTTPGPNTLTAAALASGSPLTFTATGTGAVALKPLYVVNAGSNSVTVYAAGASGDATPAATIAGGNTGLLFPYGIARDGAGNIYVTNADGVGPDGTTGIRVYAVGASGNATPMATITDLGGPLGIALDGAGNMYVADEGAQRITVYAAVASGNPTLTATIAGSNTGLSGPWGIALDGAGKIYVTNVGTNTITVYAAGASGNATPTATIAGANTGLNSPQGIALDGAGNIYIANTGGSITVYTAGASGNATPTVTISGLNTGLHLPSGIVLDGAGNIYVTNEGFSDFGGSITVYAAGASGDATPTATITGGNTGLNLPVRLTF